MTLSFCPPSPALLAGFALLVASATALAQPDTTFGDAPRFAVSGGGFNVDDGGGPSEGGLEVRLVPFTIKGVSLRPAVGVSATEDGNAWIYGSFRYEWRLAERWMLVPQVGVSLYDEGDGKDLGGSVQFRSGLELSTRVTSKVWIGALFYHLSNSGLEDFNPGSNSLVLTLGFTP